MFSLSENKLRKKKIDVSYRLMKPPGLHQVLAHSHEETSAGNVQPHNHLKNAVAQSWMFSLRTEQVPLSCPSLKQPEIYFYSISADDLYFRPSKNKLQSEVEGWILDHRDKRQKNPSL